MNDELHNGWNAEIDDCPQYGALAEMCFAFCCLPCDEWTVGAITDACI
jgi:hypothetical protein